MLYSKDSYVTNTITGKMRTVSIVTNTITGLQSYVPVSKGIDVDHSEAVKAV